jgi:hypothetical protein
MDLNELPINHLLLSSNPHRRLPSIFDLFHLRLPLHLSSLSLLTLQLSSTLSSSSSVFGVRRSLGRHKLLKVTVFYKQLFNLYVKCSSAIATAPSHLLRHLFSPRHRHHGRRTIKTAISTARSRPHQ